MLLYPIKIKIDFIFSFFSSKHTVNVESRTFNTSTSSSIKPSYKTLFASCIAAE